MEKERKQVLDMLFSKQHDNCFRTDITRSARDSTSSENIRQLGNVQFKKPIHDAKSHVCAWRFYTISIATAEPNSEERALAYGNRSALLLHLSKYDESMQDIDRALSITKNSSLRIKLLLRKAKCLYCLDSAESHSILRKAEFLINQITNESVKKEFQENVEKMRILFRKHNNPVFTKIDNQPKKLSALNKKHKINDFSAVEIRCNEKYGRHLVATKDFRVGDVIFIEEPVIKCLNLANMHGFCSHCFTVCWINIPCDNCGWAMFCSEKCKQEAWEQYHDIECSVWAYAKQNDNGTHQQLALRIIILALKKYGSFENFRDALKSFDERSDVNKGFMKDGKIQPDGLMAIYSLSRNVSKKSLMVHKEKTARALKSIALNTTWFGSNFDHFNPDNYRKSETTILLGTFFLTFSKIGQINGRQMWNHRNYPCHSNLGVVLCPPEMECCSAGSYLAPVTSLLNHSCWPNARVCYAANNTVIVYATQPIKKGDQIFDCYSLMFHEENTMKRQQMLREIYKIKCDCKPCQENWASKNDLVEFSSNMKKNYPLEYQLFKENTKIILPSSAYFQEPNYDKNVIRILRVEIEKALKKLPQPSFTTTALIHSLQRAYGVFYGISVDAPEKCNNI